MGSGRKGGAERVERELSRLNEGKRRQNGGRNRKKRMGSNTKVTSEMENAEADLDARGRRSCLSRSISRFLADSLQIPTHMTAELDAAREEVAEARKATKRKDPRGVDHVEVIATLALDAEVP